MTPGAEQMRELREAARADFSELHTLEGNIRRLVSEIERLGTWDDTASSWPTGTIPSSVKSDAREEYISRKAELERRLRSYQRQYDRLHDEILLTLDRMADSLQAELLLMRHVQWLEWDEIAESVQLSESWCRRSCRNALAEYTLIKRQKPTAKAQ